MNHSTVGSKRSTRTKRIFSIVLAGFAAMWVVVTLLLPLATAQASDEAGSASVWIPFAHSGQKDGGEQPTPVTPTPETPTPETPTPETPTPETPTATPETPTATPETPTPPPPVEAEPWAFFADINFNTNSSSVAVDANGGIHLAYHYYEAAGDGAPTYAVYVYCASACDEPGNWQGVTMGEQVNEVQLALTADGRPRLLYRVSAENNGNIFYYAECNMSCTHGSGWNRTAVASNRGMAIIEFSDDEQPQRYFALDLHGRPRFVYGDYDSFREPDHVGSYYAYCDSGCLTASNWSEVRINQDNGGQGPYRSEKFYYPVLTFTTTGQPRVLAEGTSMQDESALFYVACDDDCGTTSNWHSTPLWARGSGNNVAYDIEMTAQNQPRVAYFDGARLNNEGEWLYYGWCNQGCTDGTNWDRYDFQFAAKEGQEPDLVLDATGKPHIAYALYGEGGLGYSRCDSNCESASGQWTNRVVESRSNLASAWNVAFPPHCDGGVWDGLTPTLALDKDSNVTFAYDATYYARCWYNDATKQWEPYHQFHLVVRTVRTYFLPKP